MSKTKSIPTSNVGFISQEYIDMVLERNKFLREQLEAKEAQLKVALLALKRCVFELDCEPKMIAAEALSKIGAGDDK